MNENVVFYSQGNQDKWICEIFKYKKDGFFIDIGAMDGIQYSNSYTLEKFLGWNGICIEPSLISFKSLNSNRKSININAAISNFDGYAYFEGHGPCVKMTDSGIEKTKVYKLNSLLQEINCRTEIDFLSIDIEGEEENALVDFDFNKYFIKCITIEHNLYCEDSSQKDSLFNLLSSNGFTRVVDNAVCLDKSPHVYNQPYEDWYINSKCLDLLNDDNSKKQPK